MPKAARSRIFISYARPDASYARKTYGGLKSAGYEPWLDKESLAVGQRWRTEIDKAIKGADFVVLLLSTKSVNRDGFYQREIRTCLDVLKEKAASKVWLLPVRVDDCPILEDLADIQHADLFPDWDAGFPRLIQAIKLQSGLKDELQPQIEAIIAAELNATQEDQTSGCDGYVKDALQAAGFVYDGNYGGHQIWASKDSSTRVVVPAHIQSRRVAETILIQAGSLPDHAPHLTATARKSAAKVAQLPSVLCLEIVIDQNLRLEGGYKRATQIAVDFMAVTARGLSASPVFSVSVTMKAFEAELRRYRSLLDTDFRELSPQDKKDLLELRGDLHSYGLLETFASGDALKDDIIVQEVTVLLNELQIRMGVLTDYEELATPVLSLVELESGAPIAENLTTGFDVEHPDAGVPSLFIFPIMSLSICAARSASHLCPFLPCQFTA